MKQGIVTLCLALLALSLAACAGAANANPPGDPSATPDIISVPVKAIELVRVTPTPAPTIPPTRTPVPTPAPSPTALPAFMDEPINVDPALLRAVRASLIGLGANFSLSHFTSDGADSSVAWITDANQPDRLLCTAPVYVEGLGSLMVLSSSAVFDQFAQAGLIEGSRGCIVTNLDEGRAQVRQILERYQAVYAAFRDGQQFANANQLNTYVTRFVQQARTKPYPAEVNVVIAQMGDEAEFRVTGAPARVAGSDGVGVPLVFGGPIQVPDDVLDRYLLSDRGLNLKEASSQSSTIVRQPFTPEEAVALTLSEHWQRFVFSCARVAGIDYVMRGYDGDLSPRNALFAPYVPLSGVTTLPSNLGQSSLQQLQDYLAGKREDVPAWIVDQYMRDLRRNVSRSYLRYVVLKEP